MSYILLTNEKEFQMTGSPRNSLQKQGTCGDKNPHYIPGSENGWVETSDLMQLYIQRMQCLIRRFVSPVYKHLLCIPYMTHKICTFHSRLWAWFYCAINNRIILIHLMSWIKPFIRPGLADRAARLPFTPVIGILYSFGLDGRHWAARVKSLLCKAC